MRHRIGFDYTEEIRTRKKKRDLPLILKLPKAFDIARLQKETSQLLDLRHNSPRPDFATFDTASSEHNYHLKTAKGESFIENYDDFYRQYSIIGFQDLTEEAKKMVEKLNYSVSDLSPSLRLKGMRNTSYEKYHPHYDERNYTRPTKFCQGVFSEILNSFRSEACRSALVCLAPKQYISPHFDIGPEYLSRLMVPVFTNKDAVIGVRSGEGYCEYHLPADGSAYFINSGYEHYAANLGEEPRYQIRICLNGQLDLESATTLEPTRFISDTDFASHPCGPSAPTKSESENILGETLKEFNLKKSGSARL